MSERVKHKDLYKDSTLFEDVQQIAFIPKANKPLRWFLPWKGDCHKAEAQFTPRQLASFTQKYLVGSCEVICAEQVPERVQSALKLTKTLPLDTVINNFKHFIFAPT